MKYGFIADPHVWNHKYHGGPVEVGCNVRARECIEVLRRCALQANEEGCDSLVVLGDLFDGTDPNPQMVAQTISALQAAKEVHLIVGNHDQVSTHSGDHAMASMSKAARLYVHEDPVRINDLVLVPFQPGPAKKWLRRSLEAVDTVGGVLCMHLGIEDGKTPEYLRGAHDSIHIDQLTDLAQEFELVGAFAGNWHNPRTWEMYSAEEQRSFLVVQCGVICPKTFSDEGWDRGRLWAWEKGWTTADIVGPRFLQFHTLEEFDDNQSQIMEQAEKGYTVYVRVHVEPEELEEAREAKEGAPDGIHVEIRVDDTEVRAAAKAAAQVAKSAETFEQALVKYIDRYPIDKPGTKDGVLRRIREFRQ